MSILLSTVRPASDAAGVTPPVHESDAPDLLALDYGTDGDPDTEAVAKAFEDLDRLTLAAERAIASRKVAEEAFQRAQEAERRLIEKEIPALMLSMRQESCTTTSGITVTVKRDIKASLPGNERVADRMKAIGWLTDHGHGGVIKNAVRVDLDRGEDARADELVAELRAKGFAVESKKDVHASTLSALARELMTQGTIVPKEFFNLHDLRIAKLVRKG